MWVQGLRKAFRWAPEHLPCTSHPVWMGSFCICCFLCFLGSSFGKESAYNAGGPGWIGGLGRSPGEGNGNPLKYSFLENSMDRWAWGASVHGVAKSLTPLSDFDFMPFLRVSAQWLRAWQPDPRCLDSDLFFCFNGCGPGESGWVFLSFGVLVCKMGILIPSIS